MVQSCRQLPNFGRFHEFGSFLKIAQKFCAIFKIAQKTPQKATKRYRTVQKAPKNSTEFLCFFQKHLKKVPKSSQIFQHFYGATVAALKTTKKAPEKLPNSGEISIWRQLWHGVHTTHCTLHTAHYTWHTAHCILHTAHGTPGVISNYS